MSRTFAKEPSNSTPRAVWASMMQAMSFMNTGMKCTVLVNVNVLVGHVQLFDGRVRQVVHLRDAEHEEQGIATAMRRDDRERASRLPVPMYPRAAAFVRRRGAS